MINNFWQFSNQSNNIPNNNLKIIKSYEIKLNDTNNENIIIYPDVLMPPIFEENYINTNSAKLPVEIITNLYLGDSHSYSYLQKEFDLVINCAEELKSFLNQCPNVIELNLKLNSNEFIESKKLLEILNMIDQFLKKNNKVLICSTFGINRSVVIICAYLMWKNQMSFTESLTTVQKKYPQVNPNYPLIHHLIFSKDILYNSS